jgi:hypothetical protein
MRPARKGARAVEWTGLENRQERKLLVGSNPTPSARCGYSSRRAQASSHSPASGVEVS